MAAPKFDSPAPLKQKLASKLKNVRLGPDCLKCRDEIDVDDQPHGWLHLRCEPKPKNDVTVPGSGQQA